MSHQSIRLTHHLQNINRLSGLVDLLKSFANDYVRQTNLLLGEHTPEGQVDLFAGIEADAAALVPVIDPAVVAPIVAPAASADEKKERKKRTHDPNAPKRPLTPYFLYMQHARNIIANDLGAEAPKGAVQEEGQRRWRNMAPSEKQGWNNAYQYNLRLYNARVHSYKAGNLGAKNMSDEEAIKYADDFSITAPDAKDEGAGNAQDAIAEQLKATADETTTKTPKKSGGGRKRKSEAAPAADADTSKVSAAASPDKKRRRSTKAGDDKEDAPKKAPRKSKGKTA